MVSYPITGSQRLDLFEGMFNSGIPGDCFDHRDEGTDQTPIRGPAVQEPIRDVLTRHIIAGQ
jgi:hypothetical protein